MFYSTCNLKGILLHQEIRNNTTLEYYYSVGSGWFPEDILLYINIINFPLYYLTFVITLTPYKVCFKTLLNRLCDFEHETSILKEFHSQQYLKHKQCL